VFALVVGAVDEVAGVETVVGVWTVGDSVEVRTWDELDEVGLDVEEHAVKNDAVITVSAATIGIDFFISPTIHQRWEHYTTMTHDRLLDLGNVAPGIFGTDVVSGRAASTVCSHEAQSPDTRT